MSESSLKIKVIVACVGGGALATLLLHKITSYVSARRLQQRFEKKCKEWPENVVIVHGMPRGKRTPHNSPFVIKLETFLRMHQIPYQFECEFPFGDKQKMPWITLNGEHYTDSQLIMNFLSEKYALKATTPVQVSNDQQKFLAATATMARIVMDEHFFWGLLITRYVHRNGDDIDAMFNMDPNALKVFKTMTRAKYTTHSWYQGIGRHTPEEIVAIMSDDLRVLSDFLGSKQFLMGDEPCDDDCAVFGMLAQLVWNDLRSPYAKLVNEELPNLKEYCFRMKDRYWQDWDSVIKEGLKMRFGQ